MPVEVGAGREDAGAAPQAAPVAGEDFSGTNVQEAGIDEPDVVKTDGRRLFAVAGDRLHAVDLTGDTPRLAGSLTLDGYGHELLLEGDRLLVLTAGANVVAGGPAPGIVATPEILPEPVVRLTEIDVGDPGALRIVRTLDVPGAVVGARLRGATARIAITTPPDIQLDDGPALRRWVPALALRDRRTGRVARRSVARCAAVRRPRTFSGLGLLTVLTLDLRRGIQPVDSDAILADATTAYSSAGRLYLATEEWLAPDVLATDVPPQRGTAIHAFDVGDAGRTAYVGSGRVRGFLLSQFSLSEHRGALRVATTDEPWWSERGAQESESFVTVLDERGGALAETGRVGGLGRGERIRAVRFLGDVGFVVTFRQVDPLYALDLGDRASPRVVGELKVPGYSAYLHPIGDDLLVGVGQDADEAGRTRGAQVSLFDVSDLRRPARLAQRMLGDASSSSEVEGDHRAFLWWGPANLVVVPVLDPPGEDGSAFTGVVGLRAGRSAGLAEAGRASQPADAAGYVPGVTRSLVAGRRLYTVSAQGVQAVRLDTLAGLAWVPFGTA